MADQTSVVVPVRSAWLSRINQIAVGLFGLVLPIGAMTPFLPEPYKGYALTAVSVLGAFSIWYYKTFQTASVTPSAVANATTPTPNLTAAMSSAGIAETDQTAVLNAVSLAAATKKPQ